VKDFLIGKDHWQHILASAGIHVSEGDNLLEFGAHHRAESAVRLVAEVTCQSAERWHGFANAADTFIDGVETARKTISMMPPRPSPSGGLIFTRLDTSPLKPAEFIAILERMRSVFDDLRRRSEEAEESKPVRGPNAKPDLHRAVYILYGVWRSLNKGAARSKKDFVSFAYECLAPARAGVTRNSVLESFDRHVRKVVTEM
jgi:hypothetical protein